MKSSYWSGLLSSLFTLLKLLFFVLYFHNSNKKRVSAAVRRPELTAEIMESDENLTMTNVTLKSLFHNRGRLQRWHATVSFSEFIVETQLTASLLISSLTDE